MLISQIAELLRRSRKALGLTQREAAARARVSHRLWSEVERAERPNVSLKTALRMLGVLGVTVRLTDVLGGWVDLHDPDSAAAARGARAQARRASWSGRQLRLGEDDAPPESAGGTRGLGETARVSEQAYTVAGAPASRPGARGTRKVSRPS